MSIRPLDLQVNIAQMVNVAQQQQVAQGQPLVMQEYLGIQTQKQAKIDRERVQTIEKIEKKRIEEDTGTSQGGYLGSFKGRKKRPGKEESKEKKSLDPNCGHFIDVIK